MDTKLKIKENVNKVDLGVGITDLRDARDGAVGIKCLDIDDSKLKLNLQQQLGENYLGTIPNKIKSLIKIVGVEKEYAKDELKRVLKLQCFRNILTKAEDRLFVNYRAYRCYEYIIITKCYNCNQCNHTSKKCPNSKTCGKCASIHHESKSCERDFHCINCKLSNDKYKLNLNAEHYAYNIECPTYIRLLNSERAKIQYSEEFIQ